jgi:DivIVA domain-containing protein
MPPIMAVRQNDKMEPSQTPSAFDELRSPSFRKTLRGYDIHDVDALLASVRKLLEVPDSGAALDFHDAPRPTSATLRAAEFRLALRGYSVDDVDALLDRPADAIDRSQASESRRPVGSRQLTTHDDDVLDATT